MLKTEQKGIEQTMFPNLGNIVGPQQPNVENY